MRLYAWLIADPHSGAEGIVAVDTAGGRMGLISGNEQRARGYRKDAQAAAARVGARSARLVVFTQTGEVLDEIHTGT